MYVCRTSPTIVVLFDQLNLQDRGSRYRSSSPSRTPATTVRILVLKVEMEQGEAEFLQRRCKTVVPASKRSCWARVTYKSSLDIEGSFYYCGKLVESPGTRSDAFGVLRTSSTLVFFTMTAFCRYAALRSVRRSSSSTSFIAS